MGLWDDIYQLIYKASEKLNETFSEEIRATPDSYLLENKSKIGHGVKRIKGELQPTIDKPYTYQVDQYLKSNVPKVIQDEVKWVLLRKENNGKWRTLKTEPKKGPKVSYSFSSKNLNKTLRLEAFINAAEHKCPPAIEIKPIQGEPKIGRVVLKDKNNNEITESTNISYGDSIKAIIETTNLVGNDLDVELWERDTWSDKGHDPASADFITTKTVKVTTENKNLVVDIELSEAYMKKAMNGYFENEGDQHEYYVIVRTKGLVKYSENTANTDIVATEGKIVGFVKSLVNINNTITPIIEKEHSSPVMIGNSENEEENEKESKCYCNRDFTKEKLKKIAPYAKDKHIDDHLSGLNEAFKKSKINTCLRKIHFLAQLFHESGSLKYTREIGASDSSYGGFPGRGLIQLTNKTNYQSYQSFSGEDVTSSLSNKQKLEKGPHAARSAGWFWSEKAKLNDEADDNDFIYITRIINGGFNGYNDRLKYLKKGFKELYIECSENEKLNTDYKFKDSKAFDDKRASFAWGLWHDPDLGKHGCTKDKKKSIEGYQRLIDLTGENYPKTNWYGIKSISAFSTLLKDKKVKVREAAELRIKELKKQ